MVYISRNERSSIQMNREREITGVWGKICSQKATNAGRIFILPCQASFNGFLLAVYSCAKSYAHPTFWKSSPFSTVLIGSPSLVFTVLHSLFHVICNSKSYAKICIFYLFFIIA